MAVIVLSIVLIYSLYNYYERDYFAAMGLPTVQPSYEMIIELFGEPKSTQTIYSAESNPSMLIVQYEEFEFSFRYLRGSRLSLAQSVRIVCPSIRFGRNQIGVGSTRDEIRRTYNGLLRRVAVSIGRFIYTMEAGRPSTHGRFGERAGGDIGVIEGRTLVSFDFDENDRVKRITITIDPP